jgi:large subunit ribosomal protein L31
MKSGIHPEYKISKIKCVCGAVHETKSTRGDLNVEVCSNCHPFYTNQVRVASSTGRVDKFKKKYKMK